MFVFSLTTLLFKKKPTYYFIFQIFIVLFSEKKMRNLIKQKNFSQINQIVFNAAKMKTNAKMHFYS